jgi:hypothetical protein
MSVRGCTMTTFSEPRERTSASTVGEYTKPVAPTTATLPL